MSRASVRLVFVALSAWLTACTGEISSSKPPAGYTGPPPTFAQLQTDVFAKSCGFGGCHGTPTNAAHLSFSDASACSQLVSAPSCLYPTRPRVTPGKPDQSVLMDELLGVNLDQPTDPSCAQSNTRMPYGAAPLSDALLDEVRQWILAGAPCGGGAPDAGPSPDGGQPDAGMPTAVVSLSSSQPSLVSGQQAQVTVGLAGPAPAGGELVTLQISDPSALAAPTEVMVPAGATTLSFSALGKRPAPVNLTAQAGGGSANLSLAVLGLYISEVMYGPANDEIDGYQWVKICNAGGFTVDLTQYSLGAGANSYTETVGALVGSLDAKACALVGGPMSSACNGAPAYTQVLHFLPNLPAAPAQGPAVAYGLFAVPSTALDANQVPVDAIQVGVTSNPNFPGPAAPLVAPAQSGTSLQQSSPSAWSSGQQPTPGSCTFTLP